MLLPATGEEEVDVAAEGGGVEGDPSDDDADADAVTIDDTDEDMTTP